MMASIILLAAGCTQAHEPGEVATGIYELTIARGLDACSPSRPVGAMGSVAVLVDEGGLDAPVPDADLGPLASPRVRLSQDREFHAETNRRVTGCDGAWVHEEWTLLDSGTRGFAITHLQEWRGLSSCVEGAVTMPGAPVGDCESERELEYRLAESCEAPCSLRLTSAASIECACP
ncbi:MAG: hypothetical protein M5U28_20680 [Sandaracinaceae bacterium]|nr:hypothetical protein [Sandaracinaceae bacterium]